MKTTLPASVTDYFQAANAHDTSALLAAFTADAVVTDEGHDYQGPAIRAWSEKVNTAYQPKTEIIDATEVPDGMLVTARVSGTFPGSPVELRFRFTLADNLIAALRIEA
jgi:ketosteroid isomerase-like protein